MVQVTTLANSASPRPDELKWAPVLLVGPGPNGGWLVQDMHGSIGGQFRNRKAAVSFAKSESRSRLGRVIELDAG